MPSRPLLARIAEFSGTDISALITGGSRYRGNFSDRLSRLSGDFDSVLTAANKRKERLAATMNRLEVQMQALVDADAGAGDLGLALNVDDIDGVLKTLKARSELWRNDLIPVQAEKIEALLRGGTPVNAEAGTLLGQPIATARIPLSPTQRGNATQVFDQRLVPDQIASPVAGFNSVDTARSAATTYLAENPGHTIIAIEDSQSAVHLLVASGDTSPRTVVGSRKIFGKSAEIRQVDLIAHHPSVAWIQRSDATVADVSGGNLNRAQWPDGYTYPMSLDELHESKLPLLHESRFFKKDKALRGARNEILEINKGLQRVEDLQRSLLSERRKFALLAGAIDRPGTYAPAAWEHQPLLRRPGNSNRQVQSDSLGSQLTKLDGRTVPEAIYEATFMQDAGREGKMIAVMQDSSGDTWLAPFQRQDITGYLAHDDLRAVADPYSGTVWLAANNAAPDILELNPVRAQFSSAIDVNQQFDNLAAALTGTRKKIAIQPYSADEKIHLLPEIDPRDALEAMRENLAMSRRSGDRKQTTHLLIELPTDQSGTPAFGVVRSPVAIDKIKKARPFPEVGLPRVVGATNFYHTYPFRTN